MSISQSPQRKKSKASKGFSHTRGGHLEAWFSGDDERIAIFLHEMRKQNINTPKLVDFYWLKEQNLKEVEKP